MIRIPRRGYIYAALLPIVGLIISFCYLYGGGQFPYLLLFDDVDDRRTIGDALDSKKNNNDDDDLERRTTTKTVAAAVADYETASILDDYEFSKLLLPAANRPASAVESANLSYDQIRRRDSVRFDAEGSTSSDVLVFLHIQKTAGTTFERYLVRQLAVPRPCRCRPGRKRCLCQRPSSSGKEDGDGGFWLFSRFSNGWPCGLHADYTELIASGCVQRVLDQQRKRQRQKQKQQQEREQEEKPRRYFLTTFLREPIARYYSEFRHVTERGATWAKAMHVCNGRRATSDELPACYDPQTGWVGASIDAFLDCPYNLAANRQTRMLADLTLVNCYNETGQRRDLREATMLRSAKVNLRRMAYFGVQEDMRRSQYVFERTFGLEFTKPLLNWNDTSGGGGRLTQEQRERIKRAVNLDLELYEYAKKLFDQRFQELKADDPLYEVNMAT